MDNNSQGGTGSGNEGNTTGDNNNSNTDFSSGGVFSWIAKGLESIINAITSVVDYLNPFSEKFILKGIIDTLANILDYLNPFSENFFGTKIVDALITALSTLFNLLFVPKEESFTALTDVFKNKLGFVDTISNAVDSIKNVVFNPNIDTSVSFDYEVDTSIYRGTLSINFGWFAKFKPLTDLFITGFVYLFFAWRLFSKLPSIINGVSNSGEVVK